PLSRSSTTTPPPVRGTGFQPVLSFSPFSSPASSAPLTPSGCRGWALGGAGRALFLFLSFPSPPPAPAPLGRAGEGRGEGSMAPLFPLHGFPTPPHLFTSTPAHLLIPSPHPSSEPKHLRRIPLRDRDRLPGLPHLRPAPLGRAGLPA